MESRAFLFSCHRLVDRDEPATGILKATLSTRTSLHSNHCVLLGLLLALSLQLFTKCISTCQNMDMCF